MGICKSEGECVIETPIGRLKLVEKGGKLVGVSYSGEELSPPSVSLQKTARELDEYFAGERRTFTLDFCLQGTDFQKMIWNELLKIPYGQTKTYSEIAAAVGTKGFRAVGNACHLNKLSIIVPCHRVTGINGKLTGYAGGLNKKESLLRLEEKNDKFERV